MVQRPLIREWLAGSDGGGVGRVEIDPTADAILFDHVYKGTPLFPAAAILEIFAETLECAGRTQPPAILEDFQFVNGIRCFTDAPQKLQARLVPTPHGFNCRLTQEFCNRAGKVIDPERLCCSARAPLAPPAFDDWPWQTPAAAGWRTVHYQAGHSNRLGPSLRGLQRLLIQSDGGWGEILALPEAGWKADTAATWRFSPGVLDAALVACNLWIFTQRPGAMQLPISMRRIWLGDGPAPGARLQESFHVQDVTETIAAYDLRVRDAEGRIVLKIDDYQCAIIREPGETPIALSPPA
jgi:hypothetical protein